MLRPFADDPNISLFEGIFKKKYDFEAYPIAPIGTKIFACEPSDQRDTLDIGS